MCRLYPVIVAHGHPFLIHLIPPQATHLRPRGTPTTPLRRPISQSPDPTRPLPTQTPLPLSSSQQTRASQASSRTTPHPTLHDAS
uniref:Uncharacterized protein n=1 Tax=Aegilops tauschii subsp. strangulata TaxID=200361 RepID=A0A453PJJ3_AEGTS